MRLDTDRTGYAQAISTALLLVLASMLVGPSAVAEREVPSSAPLSGDNDTQERNTTNRTSPTPAGIALTISPDRVFLVGENVAAYDVTVTNDASRPVVVTLSFTNVTSGWSASLVETTLHVPAGGSATTNATLDAPGDARPGNEGVFRVVAHPHGLDAPDASAWASAVVLVPDEVLVS